MSFGKIIKSGIACLALSTQVAWSQGNADTKFAEPLADVLKTIETRFGIKLNYPEALVKDRTVNYAEWRFRMDNVEQTLQNILASQDLTFTKSGEGKYKIKNFEYHLKTPEEGKRQLDYLSTLYNNKAAWEKRKDSMKTEMLSALRLNPLPVTGNSKPILVNKRQYNGYSVENIALEIFPGLYIAGSVYKPIGIKGKLPVVLSPDGHWAKHRYRDDAQYRFATMARMGCLVVSYDLFAWGESLLQFKTEDHRRALANTVQTLSGIRFLDYMLSLKEADPSRVAISGGSGGGSQTMLGTALDNRITLSVPVVMMSSYHSGGCPCESGMGVHLCGGGTNNVEIAAMAAPRPQLIISDGKDWTQQVPTVEFPFLANTYKFYDAAAQVENVHLPAEGHDFGKNKRQALYAFLGKHFKLNTAKMQLTDGKIDESKVTIEADSLMYVFGNKGERLPQNAFRNYIDFERSFNNLSSTKPIKIGLIDLMLLKRQKLSAVALTKELGADGLEVDMGGLGKRITFSNQLLTDSIRDKFMKSFRDNNIIPASIAMTGYYAQSFCERESYIESVTDAFKTAELMGVKDIFLPMGVACNLQEQPAKRKAVVERLKEIAKIAETKSIVVNIETALNATEELMLLQEIGSPYIKSYFNFSEPLKNGRDLYKELEILGRDNIGMIHCTNKDSVWLQNDPQIDLKKIKQTLNKIGWTGWLMVERSRDAKKPTDVKYNYGANTAYLKSVFN